MISGGTLGKGVVLEFGGLVDDIGRKEGIKMVGRDSNNFECWVHVIKISAQKLKRAERRPVFVTKLRTKHSNFGFSEFDGTSLALGPFWHDILPIVSSCSFVHSQIQSVCRSRYFIDSYPSFSANYKHRVVLSFCLVLDQLHQKAEQFDILIFWVGRYQPSRARDGMTKSY